MLSCAFATSQHARVQNNPGAPHWKQLTHTAAHMTAHRKRAIVYTSRNYTRKIDQTTQHTFPAAHLIAACDSSHADLSPALCPCEDCARDHGVTWEANDSMRTSVGYIATYAGGCVDHLTTTCPRTYHSTESELVASAIACKRLLAIKRLIQNTPAHKDAPLNGTKSLVPLYMDNQSALTMCLHKGYTKRGAHIHLKHFKARELHNTELDLRKILTTHNEADALTKALPKEDFDRHANCHSQAPKPQYPPRNNAAPQPLYAPHSLPYTVESLN